MEKVTGLINKTAGLMKKTTTLMNKTSGFAHKMTGFIFSVLLLTPALAVAKPHAFPVPYVASDPSHTEIFFTELPGPGVIKIFNIVGETVVEIPVSAGELIKGWNVRNSSGKLVSTGVYLYRVESGDSQTSGKVVIIR